jgi:Domain of unknown function (DUF4224)
MFLTAEELAELTDSKVRSKQIEWLDQHRWTYEISRLGKPKVLRAYAEQRLGLAGAAPSAQTEPDFSHWQ